MACLSPPWPCRYKKYVLLDPLAGAITKTHVMLGAETEEKLFDAPLSISKREQLEQQVGKEAGAARALLQARAPLSPVPYLAPWPVHKAPLAAPAGPCHYSHAPS